MEWGILIPIVGIIMGCGIPMVAIWSKHQLKIAETQAAMTAEKAAQYAADNKELEQRLQVLERIVTDRGYDVATQIEALRDTRAVETSERPRQLS
ncbi:hypothetical protein MKP08_05860 [Erythrobacter sp. LQ02-29]|uniref:hypothetical protein n=1 Tax=unclassified Erythrobacter TaxID=2633097 RepID=UPI001BFC0171|nr:MULTISPECIES: hypothetical protein [unclassified Erythrobacter]MCP9222270.1 hypothetical protein [Erythrobacter sp. LQ02-29]QWC56424.1 hypothetical protein F7D01_04350 [Erythrobacter sp. 3-20A1M]